MQEIVPEILAIEHVKEIVPEIAAFHVMEFCEGKITFPTIKHISWCMKLNFSPVFSLCIPFFTAAIYYTQVKIFAKLAPCGEVIAVFPKAFCCKAQNFCRQ